MEAFLKEIGINKIGSYSRNHSYVIDLDNSEEFGKIYSILDGNEDLEYMDDNNLLTVTNASMTYRYNNEYQLQLLADFNNDTYKLVVSEL